LIFQLESCFTQHALLTERFQLHVAAVECDENGRKAVVVATLQEICQYLLSLAATVLHQLLRVKAHSTAELYLLEENKHS
jgi:hypothetical protein